MKKLYKTIKISVLFLATLGMFSSATAQDHHGGDRPRIKPSMVNLQPNATQQYYAVLDGGRLISSSLIEDVEWLINGISGGNIKIGTIDKNGLYTAPAKVTGSPEIHVMAKIKAPEKTLWGTILVNGSNPVYKTITTFRANKADETNLEDPTDIAVEQNGNILITHNLIHRFSPKGKFIETIGNGGGDIEGSLMIPFCVTVDNQNRIFITDDKVSWPRILCYSPEGKYLHSFGEKGPSKSRMLVTSGIMVNDKNHLYIGDFDLNRVNVWTTEGEFLFDFGEEGVLPGQFNTIKGLTLDANSDVFVVSYFGPCQKLNAQGEYLLSFAQPNPWGGAMFFNDITSDRYGNVYVIVKGELDVEATQTVGQALNSKKDGYNNFKEVIYQPILTEDGEKVDIIKYNNYGEFIANISLSKADRDAMRIVVDNNDKLIVLFKDADGSGVEILSKK